MSVLHNGILRRAHGAEPLRPSRLLLDMADGNPGEPPINSAFTHPKKLADWGYNGQIVNSQVEGVATFDALAPGAVPSNSPERAWAEAHTKTLTDQIRQAHAAGVKCYAWMQVLVLPQAVAARFRPEICNSQGQFDIHLPKTQELFQSQLHEIFDRLPELDGLVIRTGEIYLQALPYHVASCLGRSELMLSSTLILHGPQSHIDILNVLRDEVCVRRNKTVIYRTWDFGNNFHVNPTYYLAVTKEVEPHKNLIFSIKEQAGDFHQLTPFNPTIGIGHHQQIIEVQCQREAYGKGAHPYYIAQGAIEGFEESKWMAKPGRPRGIADVINNPNVVGIWTWSRGGGWDGPYITDELWCDLNAYVLAKYAQDPTRSEADIFTEYEKHIGLKGDDLNKFRELNLLSTKTVLRGQLTTLDAKIDLWWARDDTLSAPDLHDFVAKDLVDKAIAEKHLAVTMWKQIEDLSTQIIFADPTTKDFVVTSATYGRIKYAIIEQAWTVMLYGQQGDATGVYQRGQMLSAINEYHRLWQEWNQLKATHPTCSTLPKDRARGDKPGIGAAVDHYEKILNASTADASHQ